MVSKQSNRGLIEWIWQRISAIIIVVYSFVILSYFFGTGESASYIDWLQFYSQTHIRVLTLLATAVNLLVYQQHQLQTATVMLLLSQHQQMSLWA